MMNYVSQLKERDTSAKPNCLCGEQGRNRDEGECKRRKTCDGCGFDRKEYIRRISLLRERGLTEIGEQRKEHLRKDFHADAKNPLYALDFGRKIPVYDQDDD